MNSTDCLLLSRLESILQKKHTENYESPVNIKDILVIQSSEMDGGFKRLFGEIMDTPPDLAGETRQELLGRMETHIRNQVDLANQIHLADNFTTQDTPHLKDGAENNITRLSFSEFSFYPNLDSGPLSNEEFGYLMGKVETIAKSYDKNLHILLSSFPVKDPFGNVHNVVCYVQCGSEPKMDVFAKAIPSSEDIQYPETRNPSVLKGSFNRHLGSKIWDITKKIKDNFTLQNIADLQENIVQVRLMATEDPDFLATSSFIDSLDVLSSKLKHSEYRPTEEEINEVFKGLALYESQISKDSGAHYGNDNLGQLVPMGTLSDGTTPSLGWQYGGLVTCETAGGAKFTTAIDICMDHQYFVAKHAFRNMLELNASSAQGFISPKASQMVTSNTTSLAKDGVLAASIVHADASTIEAGIKKSPDMPSSEVVSETVNAEQAFGVSSVTRVFPSQPLELLPGNSAHTIKQQNNFNIKVEARRMFYDKFPEKRDDIHKEFMEFFATEVLSRCKYSHMLTEKEKTDCLVDLKASLTGLNINDRSIGKSLSSEIEKIERNIADSNPLFEKLVDLQENDEKRQKVALGIINAAIKKCPDWPLVNPGEQKKASSMLEGALLKEHRLKVLKPSTINGLIDEISENVSNSIYKKKCMQISIRHRGNNKYGIDLEALCAKPFDSISDEKQKQTPSAEMKQGLRANVTSCDSSGHPELNSGFHGSRRH